MSDSRVGSPLPQPPKLEWRGAPYPVTEPPLVDQDPPDWDEAIEDVTVFVSDPYDGDPDPTQQEVDDAVDVSLRDDRVREVIGVERPTSILVSAIEARDREEPPLLRCSLFSCSALRSVDVVLIRGEMTVIEVTESHVQPPPTPEEIYLAVDLGSRALGIELDANANLVGHAIVVTRVDPSDPHFACRLADVRYGDPAMRLPRFRALVDLCDQTVLDADAM